MSRAEKVWGRKPNLESDGTVSIPTFSKSDLGDTKEATGENSYTLYARCPFCKKLNHDDHVRLHNDYSTPGANPTGTCRHFIQMSGGCGSYAFVFKQD